MKKILKEAEAKFPPDMIYDITLDTTLPIKASMEEIVNTLEEAVILVLLVVYIFLQSFRATIIPMCTVPVSLLGAFIMFPVLGFSVNVLTMFGLVLAIGIVVDDAIVVVEAVQHHLEHGMTPVEATRQAMKEVSGPVVAIGLVLCAVFVPVAGMGGVTGQLYKQFALTIAVAVVFSVINALTLSPALCALLLKKPTPGRGPDCRILQAVQPVLRLAEQQLRQHRRRPGPQGHALDAAAGRGASSASGSSASSCPAVSFPTRTRAISSWPSSCPKARRSSARTKSSSRWKRIVGSTPGVRSAVGLAGYNILNSLNFPNAALMFVGLEPWEERKTPELHASALAREWTKKFDGHPRRARLCLRPAAAAGLRQRVGLQHAVAGPLRRHASSNWPAM